MIGKVLYGALFALVIPVALAAWARQTDHLLHVAPFASPLVGGAIAIAGTLLVAASMLALRVVGGGLPMNAFPPPRLVTRGPYALFAHPIYVGFVAACAGVSIALGSASGLFVVTPAVALGCAALVLGYEAHDLDARFGRDRPRPAVRLAPDDRQAARCGRIGDPSPPSRAERLGAYVLVIAPWAIGYELITLLGAQPGAIALQFPFERAWPVIEETEAVYATAYVAVLLAPLVAKTRADLRRFEVRALLASALVFTIYVTLPTLAPPRPFEPHGALGRLLAMERALDTPAGAFPSFHVIWAILAADVFASRIPRLVAYAWALAVAVSCVTTGMHPVLDVIGGALTFALVARAPAVWRAVRALTERIASSWREWRFGRVRVINHGAYAGLGAFVAVVIVCALAGPGHEVAAFVAAACSLVCAALWAQYIEGSPQLMRPYGFYGGLIGVIAGSMAAPLFGSSAWILLAAYAVAGPWVQAIGRLRCLVQGCCHGAPAPESVGIRYTHPRSRVCRIAHLRGVPVHPTPLYSIAWNVVVALITARLWAVGAPLSFIGGAYLIVSGAGRFVEESYRGEPQTPIYARLRLYQWVAIATVAAGAIVTCVDAPRSSGTFVLGAGALGVATLVGLVTAFALGVDFPDSNKRFSRLA